ncbi:hypothetical protein [Legionella londiniensis]|uniref:Uncharacterized protein n=1 Tax=Legionella londiniensis TaxID=45068 RepID=A0A0W0VM89_9GAMM|nr:hypothetical protein [Legionella londiniensis]KTD21166.1 hypothetical protein Llon_1264 [Legionella londiniensis]STX93189.1 Uncharacterised protein [Legionella londiniensis]
MPLPIIIMLERHWDAVAKDALKYTLPSLVEKGYDVLCFESPSDEGEDILISRIESTIQFARERYSEANSLLKKRGINVNLTEMNYSDLQRLLRLYVSTQYSNEMALWFRELPGHEKKLDLVRAAKSLKMSIAGVDLLASEMEKLQSMEVQVNLKKKLSAIDQLDCKRIASFKKHLLNLQRSGKGVIFVVGKFHYEQLVKAFSDEYSLSDVIFIHPHSPKCLDKSIDDRKLPDFEEVGHLTLIDRKIEIPDDFLIFSQNLNKLIQSHVDSYKSVEPTTLSKALMEKTGLSFNIYLRQSMHVDAYHPVAENEDISYVTNKLNEAGIKGLFTFFKGERSYCIPCINSTETGVAITQLKKI